MLDCALAQADLGQLCQYIRMNNLFYLHESVDPKCQEMYLQRWAPSEDSDQPAHSRSLIRIFTGRVLASQGVKGSSCGQRRPWSVCADAQADLSLRWAHMSAGTFSYVKAQLYALLLVSLEMVKREYDIKLVICFSLELNRNLDIRSGESANDQTYYLILAFVHFGFVHYLPKNQCVCVCVWGGVGCVGRGWGWEGGGEGEEGSVSS